MALFAGVLPLVSISGTSSFPAAAVTTASVPEPSPRAFDSEPNRTWGTSPSEDPAEERDKAGKVVALAEAGDRIFLGGEFSGVMPPGVSTADARKDPAPVVRRPYLVSLDVHSGALIDWDARPDGQVLSLAVSEDRKRLYVGGSFSHIGGKAIRRLAALDLETGQWDPTFYPPTPDAYVKAMALHGDRLYIGGGFTRLGSAHRPQLAALDAATGGLDEDWIPPPNGGGRFVGQTGVPTDGPDPGNVADLKVTGDGTMLIVAGSFLNLGGQSGLVALDARSGRATSWQPDMDPSRPVFGLDIWPGDGRTFFAAAGGRGGAVAAFTPGREREPQWVHNVDGDGMDVAATGGRVYFVGHFDYVLGDDSPCSAKSCTGGNPGDAPNRHIAAFDPVDGTQDVSFTAHFNTPQGPEVALVGARHLYVGGDFTKVNFDPQPGFAQFPPADNPPPGEAVAAPAGRRPKGGAPCLISHPPRAASPGPVADCSSPRWSPP